VRPPDALEPDQLRIGYSRAEQSSLFVGREYSAWTFAILFLARCASSLRFDAAIQDQAPTVPQQIPQNGYLLLELYLSLGAVKTCNASVNSL
jgi:hypothetical protein